MHVHIAVDTGMSRIGIRPDDEGLSFVARAMQCPNLSIDGIFTHFATADEADKSKTNVQYEKFSSFTDRVEKELSPENPAAALLQQCVHPGAAQHAHGCGARRNHSLWHVAVR